MTPRPLKELFDAMLHGKFRFEEFAGIDVSANFDRIGWANRTIYRPSKTLKVFQSFLNIVLFERLPCNDRVSFAYRKGKTLRNAVELHSSSRTFYQADFSKFFESLDSALIRRAVLAAPTPVADIHEYIARILELTTIEGRVPIGFATSPAISNACLKEFDDHLERICLERGLIYSRYADDIIISAASLDELRDVESTVATLARQWIGRDVALNAAKSKLTKVGRRVRILGLEILPNGRITISRELREKIEYSVHFLVSDRPRFEKIYEGNAEKGLQQLCGFISHIHSADPLYLLKLRKKFGATVIDGLLHKSLSNESH